MKHHEARVHGKKKEFECELCSKTFCYAYELRNHKAIHEKSQNNQLSGLQQVEMNTLQHDQELTRTLFECQICQKHFSSIPALRLHCNEHTQEELARDTTDLRRNENTFTLAEAEDLKPQNVAGTEHILLEVEGMEDVNEEQSYVIEYV